MGNLATEQKTTLKGYADSLAKTSPWVSFYKEVMKRTGATQPTVVGW